MRQALLSCDALNNKSIMIFSFGSFRYGILCGSVNTGSEFNNGGLLAIDRASDGMIWKIIIVNAV